MALTESSNILTTGSLDSYIERMVDRNFQDKRFFSQFAKAHIKPEYNTSITFYQPKDMDGTNAALTEGVTPAATAFTITPKVITLSQLGSRVEITDLTLTDSPVDVLREAGHELGQDAARKIDKLAQDTMDAGTNVIYSSVEDASAGRTNIDDGDIIQIEYVAEAVAKLKANDTPTFADGMYRVILHPHVAYDLKAAVGANDWLPVNAQTANVGKVFAGELGAMFGARFLESSNVQFYANASDGAGSTGNFDVYPTYVFGDNSFHMGQAGGISAWYDGLGKGDDFLRQRANVSYKFRTGFLIGREEGIYRIESSSSIGANAS